MGTNYYIASEPGAEGTHIGKQSAGHPWVWADAPESPPSISDRWFAFARANPHLRVVDEWFRDCGSLLEFVNAPHRRESGVHHRGDDWC